MDAAGGALSAAEKKTIQFGLAVAILSSCPSPGPWAAAEGCTKQRASKQLKLWQGACLGDLAKAGSPARPYPAAANHRRRDSGAASAGGGYDNHRAAVPADVRRDQLGRCRDVPAGSFMSPAAEPMWRLLASDGAPCLRNCFVAWSQRPRALTDTAISGCDRFVQALEGLWRGDCSPGMVSLFAKEMLEQVVLRGQGGCGQVYRHVLDLMVSITADVAAAAASLASAGNMMKNGATATTVAASRLARRFDVGMAVSQALDATLVQLAREFRRGLSSGGGGIGRVSGTRGSWRQQQQQQQQSLSTAISRAARAGFFLDAYEATVAFLLQAFNYLAEEIREQQEMGASVPLSSSLSAGTSGWNHDETLRPNQPPRGSTQGRGGKRSSEESFGARNRAYWRGTSIRQTTTTPTAAAATATLASEVEVGRGVLPRGWDDAGAGRNAWTQRKLEVLAEATTTMSSFRMGQLRLQRIVARVYEWARSA